MVVVAPLVILLIGAAIAVVINASTSALRANAKAQLQNDILTALDMIEQDVSLSMEISSVSSSQLVLSTLATTKNPLDKDRKLIKMPGCQDVDAGVSRDEALIFSRTYSVNDTALVKNTQFNKNGQCANAWQENNTEERPISRTSALTMSVTYDGVSGNTAQAAHITLTGTRTVAGRDISYTGTLYARSLNQ